MSRLLTSVLKIKVSVFLINSSNCQKSGNGLPVVFCKERELTCTERQQSFTLETLEWISSFIRCVECLVWAEVLGGRDI